MLRVRNLFVAPLVFALVLTGLSAGSETSNAVVREIAGAIDPSPTVTITNTPLPTATRSPTDQPTLDPVSSATFFVTPSRVHTATAAPSLNDKVRVLQVPILMYHYIGVPPANDPLPALYVRPREFESQMEWLAVNEYHPIRLMDLADALSNGSPLPENPIVLTFDDGYADNYREAFPILKNYHFAATFFLITQFIDDNKPAYMTWSQAGEMARAGMEIGSHTINHLDLRNDLRARSMAWLKDEIAGSKQTIELRLGIPVRTFCYPSGGYDARTIQVVKDSGYVAAVTDPGIRGTPSGVRQTSDKPFELKRIRVSGTYNITDFAYWLKYYSGRPQ